MLMADEDALARSAHAMAIVMLFQPLQAREHRRVFFRLMLFGAKGVIAKREEADGGGLVGVERLGQNGPVRFVSQLERGNRAGYKREQLWLTGMTSAARSPSL